MNLDDFTKATKLLFDAFTPIKPVDRLRALYEFFSMEHYTDVLQASRTIAHDSERFPTIRFFGDCIQRFKQQRQVKDKATTTISCQYCEGQGVVTAIDTNKYTYAYRCHCANGSNYANFPVWFGYKHEGKTLFTEHAKSTTSPAIERSISTVDETMECPW